MDYGVGQHAHVLAGHQPHVAVDRLSYEVTTFRTRSCDPYREIGHRSLGLVSSYHDEAVKEVHVMIRGGVCCATKCRNAVVAVFKWNSAGVTMSHESDRWRFH
jgi:hypothetical protein